jgi:hypothetical protein
MVHVIARLRPDAVFHAVLRREPLKLVEHARSICKVRSSDFWCTPRTVVVGLGGQNEVARCSVYMTVDGAGDTKDHPRVRIVPRKFLWRIENFHIVLSCNAF